MFPAGDWGDLDQDDNKAENESAPSDGDSGEAERSFRGEAERHSGIAFILPRIPQFLEESGRDALGPWRTCDNGP